MAAGSPAARAVASTLLGAMISSHDSEIARQCLPRVWATLQLPKDGLKLNAEAMQLEIPGAMRCMRAFAKLSWVQDEIIRREFLQTIVLPRLAPPKSGRGGTWAARRESPAGPVSAGGSCCCVGARSVT
jgi:hypothetical protein